MNDAIRPVQELLGQEVDTSAMIVTHALNRGPDAVLSAADRLLSDVAGWTGRAGNVEAPTARESSRFPN